MTDPDFALTIVYRDLPARLPEHEVISSNIARCSDGRHAAMEYVRFTDGSEAFLDYTW
ncbi:hypothetical protein [Kineosporia succinea]|uniref:Uncharacterized protein n=1 Tax=Kineosporia succinea TaxID=84632 RepID=A0ABT9NXP9_9ACTN|nr:hypothetical protein [Kineosporia succinea]MDP9825191.1 hypothetical protein [Kineosporia succinea]